MFRLFRNDRGQSMLEAVIATGIIVTAVSSALTLVSSSIKAEKESESLLAAGNLAREGIEAVRAIRDSNWLAGATWDAGLTGPGFTNRDYDGIPVYSPTTNLWSMDLTPNAISAASGRVYRYTSGGGGAYIGLHVQASTQPGGTVVTPFRRFITMQLLCDNGAGGYNVVSTGADCGAQERVGRVVTSEVTWLIANQTKRIRMVERIFNWR